MHSPRAGVVLLEVLCALTLLVSAGVALVRVAAACVQAIALAGALEYQREQQARLLVAHDLMTAEELADRAGLRLLGDLAVEVSPMASGLFRVTISSRRRDGPSPLTSILYAAE